MDLSTTYMGLRLANPLMPGASPLVDNLDTVRKLEDAGSAAIVMHSLFEEQLVGERLATIYQMEMYSDSFAEAHSYFPKAMEFVLGPQEYLEHLRKIKQAVKIPVIASLNGATPGGWVDYAKQIQQAGADGLELNIYYLATNPAENGQVVEQRVIEIARSVKKAVAIPVAVKLSPFFSSLPNLADQLDEVGIDALVLFNRFYQPDIDVEALEAAPKLQLSDPSELLLRLRWLAILAGHCRASLAVTGGVHTGLDALKSVLAGASAVQVVSALLRNGPEYMKKILDGMKALMEEHEFDSIRQVRGNMSLQRCPDPGAFERANYMRMLQSWRV